MTAEKIRTSFVTSLSQYMGLVSEMTRQWKDGEGIQKIEPWFRGQDSEQELIPTAFREDLIDRLNEFRFFTAFKARSSRFLKGYSSVSDIHLYVLMRHYGAPTRLLDWTESSLAALYFACADVLRESRSCQNGIVWLLNPYELNSLSAGAKESPGIYAAENTIVDEYFQEALFGSHSKKAALPVAFQPPYIDDRVSAQRSVFTFHGFQNQAINELAGLKDIFKIMIEAKEKRQILKELIAAGYGPFTLFPHLDGLCSEILASELLSGNGK